MNRFVSIALILYCQLFIFYGYSQLTPIQNKQIDSLKNVVETAKHDTTIINAWIAWDNIISSSDLETDMMLVKKIDSLSDLNLSKNLSKFEKNEFLSSKAFALTSFGWIHLNNGESELALNCHLEALKIHKEIGNQKGEANSLRKIGDIYFFSSLLDSSMHYYIESLAIAEKLNDQRGMADSYLDIGTIHHYTGDYFNALNEYSKAQKIYERLEFPHGIMRAVGSIAIVNNDMGFYEKALEQNLFCLSLAEEIGDKYSISTAYQNISSGYYFMGEYEKSLENYFKALSLMEEMSDRFAMKDVLIGIGSIYYTMGETEKAMSYFDESLKLSEEFGDMVSKSIVLNNIGHIYKDKGNNRLALNYGEEALDIAISIKNLTRIKEAAELLWRVNKAMAHHEKALEMYELFISSKDSLQNEQNLRAVIQQEYQYNYEKQHLSDSLAFLQQQELEKVEHDAELEKEAQQRYALYGGLGFLLLLGGVTFRGYTRKKKDNQLISAQKKEVEAAHEKLESTHEQLEESHQEIKDSIHYAERIQRSFLAGKELLDQHLKDYYVFFQPKDVVSGDFYWASTLQNGHFALCCADSTGHGVPGAIMSLLNTTSLEKAIENQSEPHLILDATRKIIIDRLKKDGSAEGGKDGMDCSLLVFNPDKTKLSFAAAHNPVFIVRNGELIEFKGDKMPVGKHDRQEDPFTLHQFDLQKGDVIYTLTDGFPDQFGGAKGKKYMIKNFKTKLLEIAQLPMSEQQQLLSSEFSQWKGDHEQVDDVCVIGLRI